ncbi:hypothetical protein [Microseira wollei]|uniref:Armadillo-type fold-containing protein n=1 Tax=Microseira wollei NIES-4236 TaxID=2530354 RepID=A0AAV3XP33_9CYAN|nr:hypothetical protein [Microseira wollei]GET42449.1 hypothetical protein MiSe_72660 [Microseira wollei NIES-4236]
MAQASFWWQEIINSTPSESLPKFKSRSLKSLSSQSFGKLGIWLLGLTMATLLLFWLWKLWLVMGVGVLAMIFVYRLQEWDWQLYWLNLRQFLCDPNRQLTIAVASGGLASLSTYLAVEIGSDSQSFWIAVGVLLQGVTTLFTLVLLIWQLIAGKLSQEETQFDALVADLTDAKPLKRLIAVRRLVRLATKGKFDLAKERSLADYFRLMLERESEPVVKDALIAGLQALEGVKQLSAGNPSLSMPNTVKRSAVNVDCG